jgi:hypothetical protein
VGPYDSQEEAQAAPEELHAQYNAKFATKPIRSSNVDLCLRN